MSEELDRLQQFLTQGEQNVIRAEVVGTDAPQGEGAATPSRIFGDEEEDDDTSEHQRIDDTSEHDMTFIPGMVASQLGEAPHSTKNRRRGRRPDVWLRLVGGTAVASTLLAVGGLTYVTMEMSGTEQYITTANAINNSSSSSKKTLKSVTIPASSLVEAGSAHDTKYPSMQTLLWKGAAGSASVAVASLFTASAIRKRRKSF